MKTLDEEQKAGIWVWLDNYNNLEKKISCPFNWNCEICEDLFPEMYPGSVCPCQLLSLKEVIKRAKEWVE